MSEPNKSRRQIATFLLLLFAFSALFYCLILIAHKLEAGRGLYLSGLMWCPALAAGITLKLGGRKLSELGWKWPETRYAVASWFIPLLYATIAYLIIWIFAICFWSRRGELAAIVRQPAQETGRPVSAGIP